MASEVNESGEMNNQKGMVNMCSKLQLKQISEQMTECYRRVYGEKIVSILLYGSYARGDNTDESDIDIVAIVEGERLELQKKLREVWDFSTELGLENDVVVSPTVIPYDEYEDYKQVLPYYINITKEGIRIG